MHSSISLVIGTHIKEMRTRKGMKQKELSSQLQVSAQFLGKIEKGLVPIPSELLVKSIAILDLKQPLIKNAYLDYAREEASSLFEKASFIRAL